MTPILLVGIIAMLFDIAVNMRSIAASLRELNQAHHEQLRHTLKQELAWEQEMVLDRRTLAKHFPTTEDASE